MKFHFLILLITLSNNSYAQKDYLNYHKEIIKAEALLYSAQSKACLKVYRQTFEAYPKTFARDAFLAFQVACVVQDTTEMSYFFEKAVSNGIIWGPINYSEYYKSFMSLNFPYKKRLEELYKLSREKYEHSIDQELRNYVLGLLQADDKNRSNPNDSLATVKWFKIMDSNGQKLDSLIHKIGFPGEHKAGIFNSEVVIVQGSKDYPTGVQVYSTPARIFYHNECTFQSAQKEMIQALKDGEITPKEYALMYEWSSDDLLRTKRWWDKYYKFPCDKPKSKEKQYNFFLNPFGYSKDIAFVNKCRAEIGMCTVEHEKKLKDFGAEHRLFVRFGIFGNF